jgi:tyrosyl-tRNA synthetase
VKQASKILKTDKKLLDIRFNSEWFSKMSFYDFLKLMTMTTTARVLERDMFQKRIKEGRDVGLHELMYPIMQGYDSVVLKNDVAMLGNDQKFNELFGRHYQEKFGQAPQAMMIMKLLVGTDGKEKMSKSLDNYVGITESADQIYGKIMSIPDTVMKEYFELATDLDFGKIKEKNPRNLKMRLAYELAKTYHSDKAAKKAQENFVKVFQKRELPDKIKSLRVNADKIKLTEFMIKAGMAMSISDARRKIEQGGVIINGEKNKDYNYILDKANNGKVVKVGKLGFCRIIFK